MLSIRPREIDRRRDLPKKHREKEIGRRFGVSTKAPKQLSLTEEPLAIVWENV